MKFSTQTLVVVASALASLVAGADSAGADSDVVKLTGDEFSDFVSEHPVVLAEFFAPWCGHCQALAPEYERAASELKDKGIPVAKVDCTEEEALCAEQKIQGYPTLMVFRGIDKVSNYQGARKAEAIVPYMIRQSLPPLSQVDAASIDDFSESDKLVAVGFFNDKKANTTFENLAEGLHEKYTFGASSDAALAKKYGVSSLPGLVLFKNGDDQEKIVFDAKTDKQFKFSQAKLKDFIALESFPAIGEVGPTTFSDYASATVPLLYVFVDSDKDREELTKLIKPLIPKLKGKAHVGFLDANLYGSHGTNVNLREQWPAIAIQDFKKNVKYVHSQEESITKKSLTKFVEEFASGKLEPSVKSEAVPTEQGDVTKVVGKNYEQVVIDNDRDVLVEFYAPWCGHCKNLAPIYEELGGLYAKNPELAKLVTVGQLDHTQNDVPDEIKGYPTIKLFPAGKKDSPIEFTGARNLESLVQFIQKEGTHKVDGFAQGEIDDDAETIEKVEIEVEKDQVIVDDEETKTEGANEEVEVDTAKAAKATKAAKAKDGKAGQKADKEEL